MKEKMVKDYYYCRRCEKFHHRTTGVNISRKKCFICNKKDEQDTSILVINDEIVQVCTDCKSKINSIK